VCFCALIQPSAISLFFQVSSQIQLAEVEIRDVYVCALNESDNKQSGVFSSRSCGTSRSWEIAVLKTQTEYVEWIPGSKET